MSTTVRPVSIVRPLRSAFGFVAGCALVLAAGTSAQPPAPPTIVRGTAPSGEVWSMSNNQTALASMADGSIAAIVYTQTSSTSGGHLTLVLSYDTGATWPRRFPLPQNTGHRVHDPESGMICAGRECNLLHVAWADRSATGTHLSAYYQAFDTSAGGWTGQPVLLGAGNPALSQNVWPRDITLTPLGTLGIAIAVDGNGGLGMGPWDCGLLVRRHGAAGFLPLVPMRNGGFPWSKEATLVAVDEVIHCAFKNQKGAGGIAYRSFDAQVTMQWQQPAPVMVGPNDNGLAPIDGINAGNKSMIAKDTRGGLYILYVTGSMGGVPNNNKMRMAYAPAGKGSVNTDWQDLEVLPHTATIGANPRNAQTLDPDYPQLQGGDTSYTNYTLAPGFQGSMAVVYSKPWETFQNKYVQIWQDGMSVPVPSKELNFWPDLQPYMFERLGGLRNGGSVGQAAWFAYGKNDAPVSGPSPLGHVRLWALTYSTARTISFGVGCRGSNSLVPRMHADDQFAQLMLPYDVHFERMPLLANFVLALGPSCQTLDLGVIGAPGCALDIRFPMMVPMAADLQGRQKLTWNVPLDPNLVGAYFYAQSFVFDRAANAAGATTSNALRISISQ